MGEVPPADDGGQRHAGGQGQDRGVETQGRQLRPEIWKLQQQHHLSLGYHRNTEECDISTQSRVQISPVFQNLDLNKNQAGENSLLIEMIETRNMIITVCSECLFNAKKFELIRIPI